MINKFMETDELIARNEPQITANELLAEIKPLLSDFFLGEFVQDERSITYRMPNNQLWEISAKEKICKME